MFCVCLRLCVRRKPVLRMPTISRSPQIYCRSALARECDLPVPSTLPDPPRSRASALLQVVRWPWICVRRQSFCPQPRFPAPTQLYCRSVACPAIGCAAVVKLDALVIPDTPHAPIYCRCAPDREQAHSYRFRGVQSIQRRPKTVPDRAQIPSRTKINVGARLPAKAVCLCRQYRLTHHIRQQAGSHRFSA